jgi:hypothetical protein
MGAILQFFEPRAGELLNSGSRAERTVAAVRNASSRLTPRRSASSCRSNVLACDAQCAQNSPRERADKIFESGSSGVDTYARTRDRVPRLRFTRGHAGRQKYTCLHSQLRHHEHACIAPAHTFNPTETSAASTQVPKRRILSLV